MSAPFARPEWAPLVAGTLSVVGIALLVAAVRSARCARRLLGDEAHALSRSAVARDLVLFAAFAAIGVALLAPRIGERVEPVPTQGIDLVLLFDVSRSMDATDVPPNRLARAREIASGVLARLAAGDRAALAAFGERGFLLTPLTPDTDALLGWLPGIDADLVTRRASSLGAGVRAALDAFESGSPRARVVLLLGDGEDPAGGASDDAALIAVLQQHETRLLAVTLGTQAGAAIPDGDLALVDDTGRAIRTRASPARLEALASATGGERLALGLRGEFDFGVALSALRRDAGTATGEIALRRVPAVRSTPFALFALVLLVVEAAPRRRGSRSRVAALLAGLLTAPLARADEPPAADPRPDSIARLAARVRAQPGDALALLEFGLALARHGRLDEANDALRAAAISTADDSLAALARFDLGVVALARGNLADARAAFFEALARDPADEQARFNLEWTLLQIAADRATEAVTPARSPLLSPSTPAGGANARRAGASEPPAAGGPKPAGDAQPEPSRATDAGRRPDDESAPVHPTPAGVTPAGGGDPVRAEREAPISLSDDAAQRLLDSVREPRGRLRGISDPRDAERSLRTHGVVW